MSEYLAAAAALLAKVADANERQNAGQFKHLTLEQGRLRVAREYALLAAIDKGLLPEQAAHDLYQGLASGS